VLANGSAVVSSASGDPDLWWALRGGGGGNFAVITSLSYRIPSLPTPMVALAAALWPVSSFAALLPLYARWAAMLPNTSSAYLLLAPTYASLQFVDFTNDLASLQASFASFERSVAGAYNVSISSVEFLPWEIATSGATNVDGRFAYVISELLNSSSLGAVASVLTSAILKPPTSFCEVILGHVGGVVNSVAPDATAYPYRDADFLLELKAIWPSNDTALGTDAMAWVVAVRQAVYDAVGSAPYVNYMDPGLPVSTYYGGNFARLRAVKQQVDPRDVFSFPMGIPS
jgi:FAD/FMN-containing dehydrogenase